MDHFGMDVNLGETWEVGLYGNFLHFLLKFSVNLIVFLKIKSV